MRGIIAHRLISRGVSQRKIAYYLEVTQPMVSKLLKKNARDYYVDLEKLGIPRETIDHYVDIIISILSTNDYERYISTSYIIINQLALRAICSSRTNLLQYCITGFLRDPEIEYYKGILYKVIGIRGLEKIIPEVGSNLAYAPRKPSNLSEIIGLTGRIVRTSSGVTYYGDPVYGGSKHVARILLIASNYNPHLKFCFNIRYSKQVRDVFQHIGSQVVYTGPHLKEEDFWISVETALSQRPRVVCDHGGLGLEPITYILTENPQELEDYIRELVSVFNE